MKIGIIGSRGIPANYGGFETFVAHLAPALAANGHEVVVVNEKGNRPDKNVVDHLSVIESAFSKKLHPVLFYLDSIRKSYKRCDVVIVCGVGGAVFYPFFQLSGAKWITNIDGMEHLRKKYSSIKKWYVRNAQRFAAQFSTRIIADSDQINNYWVSALRTSPGKIKTIVYGADTPNSFNPSHLAQWNLANESYYLVISRLVPENNIGEMIEGFLDSGSTRRLVIVGDTNDSSYAKILSGNFETSVTFTGSIFDKSILDSLRTGAFAYLHGHSVGGTNPSLLEAMACSCICICHDNPFNREVTDSKQQYFSGSESLSLKIKELEQMESGPRMTFKRSSFDRVCENYSWEKVITSYLEVMQEIYENK